MDAQFTASFCLLHILPFPQLFLLLFFSTEINSKGFHSFWPYKSQNTLYYCKIFLYNTKPYTIVYIFVISAEICSCLVTVFIGNEAQILENVEISTKIYIFSLSKSIMSSRLDSWTFPKARTKCFVSCFCFWSVFLLQKICLEHNIWEGLLKWVFISWVLFEK